MKTKQASSTETRARLVELRPMRVTDGTYGSKSFLPEFLENVLNKIDGVQRAFLIPENRSTRDANDDLFAECFYDLKNYAPFGPGDFVFIDRSAEAGAIRPRLQLLNELADSIGLPRYNVVYVSQNPQVALSPGVSGPSWLWFHHYLIAVSRAHRELANDYNYRDAGHKVLCLNNKKRGHRIALAKAAEARFGDRLLMSWMAIPWDKADEDFKKNFPITFSKNLSDPISLDLSPTVGGGDALGLPDQATRDSFLHLVAETEVSDYSQRFTEKVLKPIASHRPFLVFAPKGTLSRLHDLGFQTFSSVFPEDYDQIAEPEERMYRVIDIVDEILKRDRSDFLGSVAPICAHNQLHLRAGIESVVQARLLAQMTLNIRSSMLQGRLDSLLSSSANLKKKLDQASGDHVLTLSQLHQVQEELESCYLDNQRLLAENQRHASKLAWYRTYHKFVSLILLQKRSLDSKFIALAGRIRHSF